MLLRHAEHCLGLDDDKVGLVLLCLVSVCVIGAPDDSKRFLVRRVSGDGYRRVREIEQWRGDTGSGLWRCWGDIRVSMCGASPCLETSELPARDVRDLERGPFAGRAATTLPMGLVYF